MDFKDELNKSLSRQLNQDISLEIPPDTNLGDFALHCFKIKKKPGDLIELFKLPEFIEKTEIKGPYINFFVKRNVFAEATLNSILKKGKKYGNSMFGKGKSIVIDLSSPNIAKPFGIGHLRSTIIGNAIGNIYLKVGFKIIKINYLGDWGTQFGKLIVGFKNFGSEDELKKNPIKHLLEIYVKVNKIPELEDESRSWFKKLEEGDKEALSYWKKFRDLSIKEFNKIYSILNIKFDVISSESMYNEKMGKVINELKRKNLLEIDNGAGIVNLENYGLGVCLIKKSDGATLYVTRDLTAAIDRYNEYGFYKMIYEVGSEQKLHFKQLFKVLELMGKEWSKDCIHVDHGLYLDNNGKKFATRHGRTVFMSDILDETIGLVKKTIQQKNSNLKNKDNVAQKIGVGAIIYGDLKNNRVRDMVFDLDKFLDFEGDTGPYINYTYARASSILVKSKTKIVKLGIKGIGDVEFKLIKLLSEFPEVVIYAHNQLAPHVIANYCFKLSKSFNEFYHACPVLSEISDIKQLRLSIVYASREVIGSCLDILGMSKVEEM